MKTILNYCKKGSAWLLPYTCVLCGNPSERLQDLCGGCFNELPSSDYACPRCAAPLSMDAICGDCLKNPPPFDRTYSLYLYQQPITKLIMDLKFGHTLINAKVLGELLAAKIQAKWYKSNSLPEAIIPMPLHPKRLKERGFNQALEISRPIAKSLKLPLDVKNCLRIKHTAPQATLLAKDRQKNVENAFHINNKLSYQHVAVLDDVITTRFTMTEFCSALKKAGVQRIDVWCCARPVF